MPPRHQRKKTSDSFPGKGMLDRSTSQSITFPPGPGRPQIIAHRGASGHAPENTLSAFLLAAEMGADGIELDVHLTVDGEVVVIHNDTVDATTDGRGRVSEMALHELKALDAGGWYDARYAGERIPTLVEVFKAIGRRLLINVEIKVERGLASQKGQQGQLEAKVVRLIEDHQMSQQVLVSSFSAGTLRRVHKLCPNIPLGFLYPQLPRLSSRLLLRCLTPCTGVGRCCTRDLGTTYGFPSQRVDGKRRRRYAAHARSGRTGHHHQLSRPAEPGVSRTARPTRGLTFTFHSGILVCDSYLWPSSLWGKEWPNRCILQTEQQGGTLMPAPHNPYTTICSLAARQKMRG